MNAENDKSFFDSLKKDIESDLLFSKEENRKQLELQKKELKETSGKKIEELEKQQNKINEERWKKIESKLKIFYWLVGISLLLSAASLFFFLIKTKA